MPDPWSRSSDACWPALFALLVILVWTWMVAPVTARAQSNAVATPTAQQTSEKATSDSTAAEPAPRTAGIDLPQLEQQLKKTLEKVTPSVVAVAGGGSGVVISEDGYVLTVAHVGMQAGRRVSVTFPDGRRVWGRTLGNDRGVDAGLIKLSGDGPFPHAKMGTSKELQAGQWCFALGYPVSFDRGKPPALRFGRVLSSRDTTVVTDCTIMGGDSGGPLFDMDGNVIGVSSRCDNRLTMNIHVPVDCYHDTWDRLAQGEDFNSLSRNIAFLGVAPDENAEDARIGEVFPDTGAAAAGVRVGDVLLKFDGQELSKYSELPPLILKHKPGDEVEMVLRRGKEVITVKAKLGDRDD